MIKPILCLLAATLSLQVAARSTGTSAPARSLPAPDVESVIVNAGLITVNGIFSGVGTQLMLGKYRLEISDSSRTRVIAKLPQNLPAATYRLTVRNPDLAANNTSMFLWLP